MADLVSSWVIIEALQGYALGLQVPDIQAGFLSLPCCVLHRIAFSVVSEWCQHCPTIRATPSSRTSCY